MQLQEFKCPMYRARANLVPPADGGKSQAMAFGTRIILSFQVGSKSVPTSNSDGAGVGSCGCSCSSGVFVMLAAMTLWMRDQVPCGSKPHSTLKHLKAITDSTQNHGKLRYMKGVQPQNHGFGKLGDRFPSSRTCQAGPSTFCHRHSLAPSSREEPLSRVGGYRRHGLARLGDECAWERTDPGYWARITRVEWGEPVHRSMGGTRLD